MEEGEGDGVKLVVVSTELDDVEQEGGLECKLLVGEEELRDEQTKGNESGKSVGTILYELLKIPAQLVSSVGGWISHLTRGTMVRPFSIMRIRHSLDVDEDVVIVENLMVQVKSKSSKRRNKDLSSSRRERKEKYCLRREDFPPSKRSIVEAAHRERRHRRRLR
jgi:hypothetical protein